MMKLNDEKENRHKYPEAKKKQPGDKRNDGTEAFNDLARKYAEHQGLIPDEKKTDGI